MKTAPHLLPSALALAALISLSLLRAQQAVPSDDPEQRRMETELKLPPSPSSPPLTRGLRTRGGAVPAPPAPSPTETRTGFRVRGTARGGELAADASPVVRPAPSAAQPPPPPPLAVSPKQAQGTVVEKVDVIVIKDSETQLDVQFELNSTAYLDPAGAESQIARLAAILHKRPDVRLLVEGHSCDLGDDHHNNVLSFYRAEALAGHLASHLVALAPPGMLTHDQARSRIETIGFGETDPLRQVLPSDSAALAESKRLTNRRARCRLAGPAA